MTVTISDIKNKIFTEKYRPKTIDECILPDRLKDIFNAYVKSGDVPNLLLVGSAGVGKTTVAKALANELDIDLLEINGSLSGDIGTLRTEIQNFASTVSFTGNKKFVLLDEADYLNANSTQPALRNFMEAYSKNCGFIATCNFKNRIIDPLISRFAVIDFNISKKEIADLAPQFMKRVEEILKIENIDYDKKALAAVIAKYFPDWRKTLNEIQRYSATGKIDSGILVDFSEEKFKKLIGYLKDRNFSKARVWLGENEDISSSDFFRKFYDTAYDYLEKESVPQLVLHLANYQDKESRVADTQINRAGFLVECIADLNFKD